MKQLFVKESSNFSISNPEETHEQEEVMESNLNQYAKSPQASLNLSSGERSSSKRSATKKISYKEPSRKSKMRNFSKSKQHDSLFDIKKRMISPSEEINLNQSSKNKSHKLPKLNDPYEEEISKIDKINLEENSSNIPKSAKKLLLEKNSFDDQIKTHSLEQKSQRKIKNELGNYWDHDTTGISRSSRKLLFSEKGSSPEKDVEYLSNLEQEIVETTQAETDLKEKNKCPYCGLVTARSDGLRRHIDNYCKTKKEREKVKEFLSELYSTRNSKSAIKSLANSENLPEKDINELSKSNKKNQQKIKNELGNYWDHDDQNLTGISRSARKLLFGENKNLPEKDTEVYHQS